MMENFSTIGGYEQGGMYVNRAPQGFLARQKTHRSTCTCTQTRITSCHCRFYENRTESTVGREKKGESDRNISMKQSVHDQQGRAHRPCMGTELKDVPLSQDVGLMTAFGFLIAF